MPVSCFEPVGWIMINYQIPHRVSLQRQLDERVIWQRKISYGGQKVHFVFNLKPGSSVHAPRASDLIL